MNGNDSWECWEGVEKRVEVYGKEWSHTSGLWVQRITKECILFFPLWIKKIITKPVYIGWDDSIALPR